MGTHKDLDVWKESIDLVDAVYDATLSFPKEELYGLNSQMRRSAISIPSNIAEGCGRNNKVELIQFIGIARGSLAELDTQVIIAHRRHYIIDEVFYALEIRLNDIGKMLFRWQTSVRDSH